MTNRHKYRRPRKCYNNYTAVRNGCLHFLTAAILVGLTSAVVPSCPENLVCDCRLTGPDDDLALDINCRHKNLTQLPDFGGLAHQPVHSIDLSWNRITVLPGRAFRGIHFTQARYTPAKVVMNANPLTHVLDDAFYDVTADNLNLFLKYTRLVAYPFNAIRPLVNMTALNFWYSQIVDLPDGAFTGLHSLNTLDLTGNQIGLLRPSIFRGLEEVVETLYLRAMGLTAFPTDAIANLRRLNRLVLDENKIHVLYGDIFFGSVHKPRALAISMQKNGLEFIAPDAFRSSADVKIGDLDLTSNNLTDFTFLSAPCALAFTLQNRILAYNNPIDCDCVLYSVLSTGFYTFDGRCHAPNNMSGLYVQAQYGAISKVFDYLAKQSCRVVTTWDLSCTVISGSYSSLHPHNVVLLTFLYLAAAAVHIIAFL